MSSTDMQLAHRRNGASEAADEELLLESEEELRNDKYLLCTLGKEDFGLDISFVTDIIELQKITEVPDMPQYVRGVINLRGQVIPVIDLRLRFGMEAREYDDRTVIIVVNVQELSVGFVVDTVTEVKEFTGKDIDPSPRFDGWKEGERYIAGLGKSENEVVILLDVERIVDSKERSTLAGRVHA
jgi:purine-binding chemotaxis protein CheW